MNASRRQWLLTLAGTIGLLGSLATAQAILARHLWRIDLTPDKRYVLSDHARRILKSLDRDVVITAFLRPDDPRNEDIEDLLWRVSAASDRVRYRLVDVNRNPALARLYGVGAYGTVAVESAKRRKLFANPNETLLMAAIVQVTRPGRIPVYFLLGHGEHDPFDRERRGGYLALRRALAAELYDVRTLRLTENADIPEDAGVVVVAGPQSDMAPRELLAIDRFLRSGGSVLALLDPGPVSGMEAILAQYGISVPNEVVIDPANRQFAGDPLTMQIPGRSPQHPVTAGLREPPLFSTIRPVEVRDSDMTLAAVEMLRTGSSARRTQDPIALRFPERSLAAPAGPIPVAAGALLRNPDGPPGRIIVVGDSDFADNSFLDYLGNRDFILNAMNWLAGEIELIASRPPRREPGVEQIFLSAEDGRRLFWIGTILQPAMVLVTGALVYAWRRWTG